MPELTDEQKAAQAAAKAAAEAATKEAAEKEAAEAADEGGEKPNGFSELPEWAQKEIENRRKEAASYRTRLRETEEKLAGATPEDLAKAVAEVRAENERLRLESARSAALVEHGLPEAAAALLDGDSAEAIKAKAAALVAFRGEPQKDPLVKRDGTLSGGRTPGGTTDAKSGAELWREHRKRR